MMAQPEQLLPRNERNRKEAKIIDENRSQKVGGCTDCIANMLDWQDWRCTGMNALRGTESKEARRTNRPVAAWLNNGARLLNRLSSWPLAFENFREDVRRWARLYEDEEEERRKWAPLTSIQDIHDLRRTTATGMAKIGVPPHIVEACLNHVSGGAINERLGRSLDLLNQPARSPHQGSPMPAFLDGFTRIQSIL
jgi:hypothetical protein